MPQRRLRRTCLNTHGGDLGTAEEGDTGHLNDAFGREARLTTGFWYHNQACAMKSH
jgi:hypothetical protein